jgi:hypothetical protein
MYWYIPVHTRIYQHLLWFPIHQFRPSPLLDTWRYMEVHGSTGKSCIPGLWRYFKVHGSTKPCTLMYLDLPWSTAIIQVYRTFRYCHVLPCTLMYLHVSSNGEGRNWWIGNQSNCWYIPVHTSTYQNIPGHTNTYQYIPVHTSAYCLILIGDYVYWYIPVYGFDW